ncbi:hypothetical protein BC628DRAFT_1478740 [Trametes gibbosa]|nr:hypothetical protein BC628DRAFT_1478740 [Trametes gibbosa]
MKAFTLRLLLNERPLSDYRLHDGKSLSEEAGVELYDSSITRWTNDTIRKVVVGPWQGPNIASEAYAMRSILHHTTIPVPRVHHVISHEHGRSYIFMDHFPGRQLAHVWPPAATSANCAPSATSAPPSPARTSPAARPPRPRRSSTATCAPSAARSTPTQSTPRSGTIPTA